MAEHRDGQEIDDETESATVRRWTRADWGDHGRTMAWCCTELSDGGEAYCGDERVVSCEQERDECVVEINDRGQGIERTFGQCAF